MCLETGEGIERERERENKKEEEEEGENEDELKGKQEREKKGRRRKGKEKRRRSNKMMRKGQKRRGGEVFIVVIFVVCLGTWFELSSSFSSFCVRRRLDSSILSLIHVNYNRL